MASKTPPFNEKKFLLNLLAQSTKEHGDEKRHINNYVFDSIDPDKYTDINELSNSKDILIKKHISQWFKEADVRGFVVVHQNHLYKFTEEGYQKARSYKHPIKYYIKNNDKFIITTALAFIVAMFTIWRVIKC